MFLNALDIQRTLDDGFLRAAVLYRRQRREACHPVASSCQPHANLKSLLVKTHYLLDRYD
jgi:hypothetical protein